jgi:CelD/BcsL family acetyltransferase involved in cellulose biosynthesis
MSSVPMTAQPAAPASGAVRPARGLSGTSTVEIVCDADAFAALRRDWDDLFARAGRPHQYFQSHAFLDVWMRHYLDPGAQLFILTIRRHRRLQLVWPLLRRHRFGFHVATAMGRPIGQFDDLLVAGEEADDLVGAAWRVIADSGVDLLLLRCLRDDSALARHLQTFGGHLLLHRDAAPFHDLSDRADGGAPAGSARDRSSHRRRLRRLGEFGKVEQKTLLPGDPGATCLIGKAVAYKRERLARNGILSPTVTDPRFEGFFVDCAADRDSALRLATLEIDGRPVGIDLSFDCLGTSFGHVIATDPDLEKEGIGSVLVQHVFAASAARGNTRFDMLAPADAYKMRLADGSVGVSDLVVPLGMRGRLAARVGLVHGLPLLRRAAKALPPRLVRMIAAGRI